MATTSPVRVPAAVHQEVQTAARLLGCNASELMARAWEAYRQSPAFLEDFELAQKAFATGDLEALAQKLVASSQARAVTAAERVRAMRRPV